jgi:hypothetical protein
VAEEGCDWSDPRVRLSTGNHGAAGRFKLRSNKRLKLSSSRGDSIQEPAVPEATEEPMMLMNCKLCARSLSADR